MKMFKQKIHDVFVNLLIEASATHDIDCQVGILADRCRDWLYREYSNEDYYKISNRIAEHRNTFVIERQRKEESDKKKLEQNRARHTVIVPDRIAEEALLLWKEYEKSEKDILSAYRFERLILANCPEFKEFNGFDYELSTKNGELLITELFED